MIKKLIKHKTKPYLSSSFKQIYPNPKTPEPSLKPYSKQIPSFNQAKLAVSIEKHQLLVGQRPYISQKKIQFAIIFIYLFKNLMKRELKKEELAKLYREFSRQKYNKYRHQFPRMRESELVSKIIKEWEAFSLENKQDLYHTYTTEKHISDDKSESSQKKESPGSSKEKRKKSQSKSVGKGPRLDQSSQKTPSKRSSGLRVYVKSSSSKKDKQQQSVSSDFARDGAKKDFEISESDSKELGIPSSKTVKRKRITKQQSKQPRTEYLKFFKFYYEKLSGEHSRWTASQISTIIKLLWKKKLTTDKATGKAGLRTPRKGKRQSGRMVFRRAHGYTLPEAVVRWRQLTIESKKYWMKKGEGASSGDKKGVPSSISFRKNLIRKGSDSSINTNVGKNLGYLRKPIS